MRLAPGERRGFYVHSKQPGDDAIVYDNQRSRVTYEDDVFQVLPGLAHLSNKPFGRHGMWGFPWRENREFVGRFFYGVGYKLWNPEVHSLFPNDFQRMVSLLLLCARRTGSPLHALQDEVIYYILNMCKYDWFRLPSPAAAAAASTNVADRSQPIWRSFPAQRFHGRSLGALRDPDSLPLRPLVYPGPFVPSSASSSSDGRMDEANAEQIVSDSDDIDMENAGVGSPLSSASSETAMHDRASSSIFQGLQAEKHEGNKRGEEDIFSDAEIEEAFHQATKSAKGSSSSTAAEERTTCSSQKIGPRPAWQPLD